MSKNIPKIFMCIGVLLFLIPLIIPNVYGLYFLTAAIIFIVLSPIFFFLEKHDEKIRNRNKIKNEIKSKFQQAYSEISMGMDFNSVNNKLVKCKSTIPAHLVSEVVMENGINRKVFVWYLDWGYVSDKWGADFANGQLFKTKENQLFNLDGGMKTFQQAFIQMIFENDKLVAKEQQGLYQ